MARPREFNPDDALTNAMKLFWRKGYFDTSVDELVKETGVSRKGLYTVFGNKHELFLKSLVLYRKQVVSVIVKPLEAADAGADEIALMFAQTISFATSSKRSVGCLMCNTALEMSPEDEESRELIRAHFIFLAGQFQKALRNAQDTGQISSSLECRKLADHLVGLFHTIPFFARAGAPKKLIENTVEIGLGACGIKAAKIPP